MQELLPVFLGVLFGTAVATAPLPGPRSAWFVGGCIVAGALASWINGELASSLAALFLSFDALLAWCGGAASFLGLQYYRGSAGG